MWQHRVMKLTRRVEELVRKLSRWNVMTPAPEDWFLLWSNCCSDGATLALNGEFGGKIFQTCPSCEVWAKNCATLCNVSNLSGDVTGNRPGQLVLERIGLQHVRRPTSFARETPGPAAP